MTGRSWAAGAMRSPCALGWIVAASVVSAAWAGDAVDVWIGTGRGRPSEGIYHVRLDRTTGKLGRVQLVARIDGPGFLARHPTAPVLYAVGTLQNQPVLAAYRIGHHGERPELVLLEGEPIGDGGAAHVTVDRTGRVALTAQYGGGSVAVFALDPESGRIRRRTQIVEHRGASMADPKRQRRPHPHWVGTSPDNRFVFVPDLGLDQVVIYRLDPERAQLTPHGKAVLPAGAGPRHMKFHPSGKWIYVLNELDLTLAVFDYDAAAGTMRLAQVLPTVPKEQVIRERYPTCSEVRVHPSGQFVYAANRGHDTITVFRVDPGTGRVTVVEREPIRGSIPRNFALDPSGRWLIAAGQTSHTLASFAVDPATGALTYTMNIVSAPRPICVLFESGPRTGR